MTAAQPLTAVPNPKDDPRPPPAHRLTARSVCGLAQRLISGLFLLSSKIDRKTETLAAWLRGKGLVD